jgi:hypothetical protein
MRKLFLFAFLLVLASCQQPLRSANATVDECAVVLNTPDGFLALREGPGVHFRLIEKLKPGTQVDIPVEGNCYTLRNGNVVCNSSGAGNILGRECRNLRNSKTACSRWIKVTVNIRDGNSGWVRSKFIHPVNAQCEP